MNVFKKIESDPVINKSTQISAHDPEKFRFLSNLYWPFTEYGQLLEDSSPQADYPVWPSLYYNTSSLLYQNPESTKYFLDFYQGYSLPVSYSAFPSLPEGDSTDSIIVEDINNPSATYIPYFIPSQTRLFSSAWAHYAGSGGFDSSFGYTYTYPTKAIYNQIKMLFNETQSIKFKIQDEEVDHFFAVVFDQKNLTGSIVPNTVVLPLMKVSDLGGTGDETSQITYTFTDKSQSTLYSDKFGYYSYLVSGNLSEVSSSEVFGTILYDYKTIILNTEKLETSVFYDDNNGTSIYTGSVVGTFTNYTNFYTTASQATNSYMLGRLLRNSQLANNGPIIDENNPLTATDFKFDLKTYHHLVNLFQQKFYLPHIFYNQD